MPEGPETQDTSPSVFFFQAEDGIRDRDVTGGQTCALPIWMRLNIPAGTAVRFEPGDTREVELVALGGTRHVQGLNGLTNGPLDEEPTRRKALEAVRHFKIGRASCREGGAVGVAAGSLKEK